MIVMTAPQRRWTAALTWAAAQVSSVLGSAATRLRGVAWAIRTAIDSALSALSDTLTHLKRNFDQHGREPLDPGWTLAEGEHLNQQLADVAQARSTARQVVRAAPRRRAARPVVEALEQQATQITLLAGTVLNLARTTTAAVQSGEDVPAGLRAALSDLAEGLSGLAHHDTTAASRAATRAVGEMADQHSAGTTSAPLIALIITACGRDLERLAALTDSAQHPK